MADELDFSTRDLFALGALVGLTSWNNDFDDRAIAELSYSLADEMMVAREGKKVGLPAIKRRSK